MLNADVLVLANIVVDTPPIAFTCRHLIADPQQQQQALHIINRRMQRSAVLHLLLLISTASSAYGLSTLPTTPQTSTSRRNALNTLVGFGAVSFFGQPALAAAVETPDEEETQEQKKARLLKERIAASKKNYRKADSYSRERFTTVDYSCVADTGSPCKEPKSVFPSDEKIALDGKIEDL